MAKIAFVRPRQYGLPTAPNFAKAGHGLTGFDVVPVAVEAVAKAGIKIAQPGPAAVDGVDTVIATLPSGKLVPGVYDDILKAAAPGTLFIDSSTIDVASARSTHESAAAAGMESLDAPVSGNVGGAAAGTLTFMCGGRNSAFTRGKPILELMGKKPSIAVPPAPARPQKSART